ncbi:hypothetical protein M885DRAFT_63822 [Pelagophyceae sp. CCMP2097]|nr:hypothetical protein M885DRAFT_63822 [Pelagophyceae sp. CCMP2097]
MTLILPSARRAPTSATAVSRGVESAIFVKKATRAKSELKWFASAKERPCVCRLPPVWSVPVIASISALMSGQSSVAKPLRLTFRRPANCRIAGLAVRELALREERYDIRVLADVVADDLRRGEAQLLRSVERHVLGGAIGADTQHGSARHFIAPLEAHLASHADRRGVKHDADELPRRPLLERARAELLVVVAARLQRRLVGGARRRPCLVADEALKVGDVHQQELLVRGAQLVVRVRAVLDELGCQRRAGLVLERVGVDRELEFVADEGAAKAHQRRHREFSLDGLGHMHDHAALVVEERALVAALLAGSASAHLAGEPVDVAVGEQARREARAVGQLVRHLVDLEEAIRWGVRADAEA